MDTAEVSLLAVGFDHGEFHVGHDGPIACRAHRLADRKSAKDNDCTDEYEQDHRGRNDSFLNHLPPLEVIRDA
jgi:hypothetical protein